MDEEKQEVQTTNRIEEAKAVVARLEAANAKNEELIARAERLKAEEVLGGKSEAGKAPKEEEKKIVTEEDLRQLAKQFYEGKTNPFIKPE